MKAYHYLIWAPGCIFIAIALGCFGWIHQPYPAAHLDLTVQSVSLTYPGGGQGDQTAYRLSGPLMVSLSYPMRARLGDSVPVQMVVQSKKLDSAPFEIQAVAQIELPGMVFSPDGAEMEGFSGGKAQQYDWKGTAQREGSFSGRVWLSFRMIDAANHAGPETVVSAQPITILAYALFGKNQAWVTNCAWICAVCGLICTFVAARLGKRSSPFGG